MIKARMLFKKCVVLTAIFLFVFMSVIFPIDVSVAQQNDDSSVAKLIKVARQMRERGLVRFDFKDLDLMTFIKFMAELTGKNFVVDPKVRGKVTVVSPRELNINEAYEVFLSVLELNGWGVVKVGNYYKITSLKSAKLGTGKVLSGKKIPRGGEDLITQVVPVDFVDASEVVRVIKPLLSNRGMVTLIKNSNMLLIHDTASSLQNIMKIVKVIDGADTEKVVSAMKLKYAMANDVATKLDKIAKSRGGTYANSVFVPDTRTNKVIVVVNKNILTDIKSIVQEIDQPPPPGGEMLRVYRLRYADAESIAKQLKGVIQTILRMLPKDKKGTQLTVVADKATNSLIIAAPPDLYREIEKVIQELDVQRKQVLIKGLIAEVNLTKLKHAGIDWATWLGKIHGDVAYIMQGDLGTVVNPDIVNAIGDNTGVGGILFGYLKLLEKYDAINVLSVPQLLCTDNQTSKFQVGKVIPALKSTIGKVEDPSAIQKSYEYKETGIILEVTPRVRSENVVDLDIKQIIEDVITASTVDTPVTSKREIKTTVQVRSGQTIILGGLMKDVEKLTRKKIPGLVYIPIIGNLFRTVVRQRDKVDLLIFLTPYIITNPKQATYYTQQAILQHKKKGKASEDEIEAKIQKWLKEINERNKKDTR